MATANPAAASNWAQTMAGNLGQMHAGLAFTPGFDGLVLPQRLTTYAGSNPAAATDLIDTNASVSNDRVIAECPLGRAQATLKAVIGGNGTTFESTRFRATEQGGVRESKFTYNEESGATLISLAQNQALVYMTSMSVDAMGLSALGMVGEQDAITSFFTGARGASGFETALKMMAMESYGVTEDALEMTKYKGLIKISSLQGMVIAIPSDKKPGVYQVFLTTRQPFALHVGEQLQGALSRFSQEVENVPYASFYSSEES